MKIYFLYGYFIGVKECFMFNQVGLDEFRVWFSYAWHNNLKVKANCSSPLELGNISVMSIFFLSEDKKSGYAITFARELCFVFSTEKGRGAAILKDAQTKCDFLRLDCFDGYLPKLYAKHGFVETHRELNWKKYAPDVVYMEWYRQQGWEK